MIRFSDELAKRPHNFYILAYCLDDENKIAIGITSRGKVQLIKSFGWSPHELMELEEND